MSINNAEKYFLENITRLKRGLKISSERLGCTLKEAQEAKENVQDILTAKKLMQKLKFNNYTGNIDDIVKTVLAVKNEDIDKTSDFKSDLILRKEKSKYKELEDKYKTLLNEHEILDNRFNDSLRLNEQLNIYKLPEFPQYNRQGASLIIYSDWHVGQVINRASLNGLNEYNPEVCKKRAMRCFDSTIKLIRKDKKEFNNHTTVIFLNGDFINGYIHPEAQKITNSMTPIEEVIFSIELLSSGLSSILEHSTSDKIVCICHNGNHARVEKRMESSIDHRTSYESMLYANLALKFKDEIEFIIPKSDISYTNILNKNIRAFHGHQCKFGGGIGGLTIPLTKFIQRQDTNIKADFNIMSHYHQFSMPTKNTMLNGSLIGIDNFCQTIGASGETPMQAYRLLDSKYGFTSFNPIICE